MRRRIDAASTATDGYRVVVKYGQPEFGPFQRVDDLDGEEVAHCHVPIAEKGFSDVVLAVPGGKVPGGVHEIAFVGDHIACGYWLYQ